MAAEQVKGSFAISFPEKVVLAITQRVLDEDATAIDSTVIDRVGELTIATGGGQKATI